MEKQVDQRYLFSADAVALGGQITHPFCDVIDSQASAVLPITGGHGSARVEGFRYRELVSFKTASSTVTGNEVKENGNSIFHTLTTVTVEGLNVANVVTADAIVARLVSSFDRERGRRVILPVGSAFVNLRIAGARIDLPRRRALFESGTLPDLTSACQRDRKLGSLGEDLARLQSSGPHSEGTAGRDSASGPHREQRLLTCLFDVHGDEGDGHGEERLPAGCGKRGECGIRVPGFGTVFLGEFYITRASRRLTMLRIEMGCPVHGTVTTNIVGGNGSDYP